MRDDDSGTLARPGDDAGEFGGARRDDARVIAVLALFTLVDALLAAWYSL